MNDKKEISSTIMKEGNESKHYRFKSEIINKDIQKFFEKRIRLKSAFYHKGAKQFLHSKKVALKKIVIDDNDNSSINEEETQNDSNKKKEFSNNNYSKGCLTLKNDTNKEKSSNNIINISSKENVKDNHLKIKSKNKLNNSQKKIKTLLTKELKLNKTISKFLSSQEIKMIEDKEIKKIKPIKKSKNDLTNKNGDNIFPFVESENSIDSSLVNIVSEMH